SSPWRRARSPRAPHASAAPLRRSERVPGRELTGAGPGARRAGGSPRSPARRGCRQRRLRRSLTHAFAFALAPTPPPGPLAEPLHVQEEDRGHVEREELREDEAAHHREPERPARLRARAEAERDRQGPE